jgi:hypothetical protein
MSFAMRARQSAPAAGATRAAPHSTLNLRVGKPDGAFEREADRMADSVMQGGARLNWSFTKLRPATSSSRGRLAGADAPPGSVPASAIVRKALASPGQPLKERQRAFFEQRFSQDFSAVRIHSGDEAHQSAKAVQALAYTVNHDIVFAHGQFRPETLQGRRLLGHELAHVVQQARTNLPPLQRQAGDEASSTGSLYEQAFAAADESRWEVVAEIINRFDPEHLRYFLGTFKGQPDKLAFIYLGATGNARVGKESPVALATKVTYLDFNFQEQLRKKDWSRAAYFLNEFNRSDIMARLNRLDSESVKAIHEGAIANSEVGADSGAAKVSAEVLAGRSARGDAKALLLPTVRGEGREALARVMRDIDGIRPSGNPERPFTMVVDGQPETLSAAQADEIRGKAAGVLKDHLRRVQVKAATAREGYQSQTEVDKQHWLVAPIVKTLGRVKDPGPDLLAYVARANADVQSALEALAAGHLEQAAELLATAEGAALSATKMWQAYFQGIISAGEMTVTVLEITRDAAFATLAVLATIATGGAAAGVLSAEGVGATTTVSGVEVGTATAANVVAAGAPIVANLAEAVAKVSMGDKVDWGALVVDTAIQIIIARFGGRVTGGIAKALLGNPATESLAARVTEGVVHTAILHVGSTALTTAAQDAYRALRGQNITWQAFADDLIARLTDPKGLAVVAVTGALTSAAAETGLGARPRATPEAPGAARPIAAAGERPAPTGVREGLRQPAPAPPASVAEAVPTAPPAPSAPAVEAVPAAPPAPPAPAVEAVPPAPPAPTAPAVEAVPAAPPAPPAPAPAAVPAAPPAPAAQAVPAAPSAPPPLAAAETPKPPSAPLYEAQASKGPEVFGEISAELGLETATGNVPGGIRSAVAEARAAGFIQPQGGAGSIDLAVQPHGTAPTVRGELGITGSQAQSAHLGPTSALRSVPGYSREAAETTLLPPDVHAGFDNYWKQWAMAMRRQGRVTCTAAELHDVMLEAIDQTPNLTQRTKGAPAWRLQMELFRDLGLQPSTVIALPYPNIHP